MSIGRFALIAVGVIALGIGAVFTGQGANLIPGSFMTGSRTWLGIGVLLVICGIVMIIVGARRPKRGR